MKYLLVQPMFRDSLLVCALRVGGSWQGGKREGGRLAGKVTGNCKQGKNCIPCYLLKKKKDKKYEVLIESVILN